MSLSISNQDHFNIVNTVADDLPIIIELFEHSIVYQEKHGYPVWKNYDQDAIRADIESINQYKVIVDGKIGMVFSVGYEDKIIWRELDCGNAVYLHRIVVNPACKGRKLFGLILEWSVEHAKQKGLNCVRMDTWASNANIISYYTGFGFSIIENYITPDSPQLPVHNRNLALTLMEYRWVKKKIL